MDYINQQIAYIAKIRNLPAWDREFNYRIGFVESHIAKLRAFGNLPNASIRVKNAVNDTADRLQDQLEAAIRQRYQNS